LDTFIVSSPLSGEEFDVLQKREVKSEKRFSTLPLNSVFSDKQSQFFIIGGDIPFFSINIIFRHDGSVAVIPQNVLGNLYFNTFREKIAPVFTKTIRNLLNIRDHLLLQMDLECGNISEEYFDKEEPKYLSKIEEIPPEKLKEEIKILFGFTNLPLDSVDISEILNCSVDDAEKMLNQYINGV